jgi:hypothetical protein
MKRGYSFTQHGIVIYDIKKQEKLRFFVASIGGVKDFLKSQALKQPNLVQLDKVLHKGFCLFPWASVYCSLTGLLYCPLWSSNFDHQMPPRLLTRSTLQRRKLELMGGEGPVNFA